MIKHKNVCFLEKFTPLAKKNYTAGGGDGSDISHLCDKVSDVPESWDSLTFPIASLNHYNPKFSGVPQKLTWCQQFGIQIIPKWGEANENAFLGYFLDKISFPGQTVDFRL